MTLRGKDKEILNKLLENSRTHFVKISKECDIADTTVHFRVNKLKEQGIIKKFTIELDLDKLGLKHKAIIIASYKSAISDDWTRDYTRLMLDRFKKDKRIGFLARSQDEKTIIALFVTDNEKDFNTIFDNFENDPNKENVEIIQLTDVEKFFIDKI
ncbi:MAG: Lrp/AsnC family transcriptional regulator [Promethearchaeota archaeon]